MIFCGRIARLHIRLREFLRRSSCTLSAVSKRNCLVSSKSSSDAAVKKFNAAAMKKAKAYADLKRKAAPHPFGVGDSVLVRQLKKNKLSARYDPLPYKVVAVKGSMVSARRKGHSIVRNSSFFKKITFPSASGRRPCLEPSSQLSSPSVSGRRPCLKPLSKSASSKPTSTLPTSFSNPATDGNNNDQEAANIGGRQPDGVNGEGVAGDDSQQATEHVGRRSDDDRQLPERDEDAGAAPAEDDSGDEVFVDAEEEEDQGLGVPLDAPSGGAIANPPMPAFHPSPGLSVSNRPFSLPNSIKPGSLIYNFRPRPGGRTD